MALPPGPALPAFAQTLAFAWRPARFVAWCAERYGQPFTLRLVGRTLVMVSAPEHVRVVTGGQDPRVRMSDYNNMVTPIVGEGSLLVTDGDMHSAHRRLLLEPFRVARVHGYSELMAEVVERHLQRWQGQPRLLALEAFEAVTLDIILAVLMGIRDPSELDALRRDLHPVLGVNPLLLMAPALQVDLGPWSPWGRFLRRRRSLDAQLLGRIRDRRRLLAEAPEAAPDDALTCMLSAAKGGAELDDEALLDELKTLIATGHETTAGSLAWALGWLVKTPDVYARLQEELDALDGARAAVKELDGAPYLDAVCKEAMRINPVLPGIPRDVTEPIELGLWRIPAGVQLVAAPVLSHRLEASFPEPERFKPERFLGQRFDRSSYYPFGGGPRMCLGWSFGVNQMKLVLARALSRYTFSPTRAPWPSSRWRHVTLIPRHGVPVGIAPRAPRLASVSA